MNPQMKRLLLVWGVLTLTACSGSMGVPRPYVPAIDGWIPEEVTIKPVGLGVPGGAALAPGVTFAGGIEIVAPVGSPLHSLSDLKLTGDGGFVTVSDAGDLVRGALRLDAQGRLTGIDGARARRLTLTDGAPIQDKLEGDAEGLALLDDGELLVSFERDHRIWNYGPLAALRDPVPVARPDFPFPENDGMEGLTAAPHGWRVNGESGGVWGCTPGGCTVVTAPPTPLLRDSDYRITGMDRDPAAGPEGGWFVVQRSYAPPIDARARVRRMAADGTLGPVLVELKLPGTTDNFEGIAAETRTGPHGERTRIYILSDDNFSAAQRTLMLAFDVTPSGR
ncbi:esterase-like activity of phytase family protein [Brevundimonas goettingensis]|uniref:Esterase-like activity of phytase family protein n=2 Tax=Brevundimonas goettingensis TaxID=2774190 RepID=A0A975C183_9CAUL|nr:esterase-like activity of phytase family protein [Brevundimonas goettingensis]